MRTTKLNDLQKTVILNTFAVAQYYSLFQDLFITK